MAKAKIAELPTEVAQIVYYMSGNPAGFMVRFSNMADAQKQFAALAKAAEQKKPFTLRGPASTALILDTGAITSMMLVNVDMGNFLMSGTQKRLNAMMTTP